MATTNAIQFEHPKKALFLEHYGTSKGHISDCARAVSISRSTYYEWLKNDEEFRAVKEALDSELNDEMRNALIELAGDGNLGAIIFYLKRRHPEFRQDYSKTVGVRTDGEIVEVVVTDYK